MKWILQLIDDWQKLVAEAQYCDGLDEQCAELVGEAPPKKHIIERLFGRWVDLRVFAAYTVISMRVGAAMCRRFGHKAEVEEGIACERDERGRITDIDGGYVDWFCPRCGQGGRSWF